MPVIGLRYGAVVTRKYYKVKRCKALKFLVLALI